MLKKMMVKSLSVYNCDKLLSKRKWHLILPNYMDIPNHHSHMGINFEDYWTIKNKYHVTRKSHAPILKEDYVWTYLLFRCISQIQPLHVRDWLNRHDDKSHNNNVEVVEHSVDDFYFYFFYHGPLSWSILLEVCCSSHSTYCNTNPMRPILLVSPLHVLLEHQQKEDPIIILDSYSTSPLA